jgi:hypothetical protein
LGINTITGKSLFGFKGGSVRCGLGRRKSSNDLALLKVYLDFDRASLLHCANSSRNVGLRYGCRSTGHLACGLRPDIYLADIKCLGDVLSEQTVAMARGEPTARR